MEISWKALKSLFSENPDFPTPEPSLAIQAKVVIDSLSTGSPITGMQLLVLREMHADYVSLSRTGFRTPWSTRHSR